jgi:hypothetical protein
MFISNPEIFASSVFNIHGRSVLRRRVLTVDDELYTRSDLYDFFDIDSKMVDSLIKNKGIAYVMLGGYYYFPAEEVDATFERRSVSVHPYEVKSLELHRQIVRLQKRMSPEAIALKLGVDVSVVNAVIYGTGVDVVAGKKRKPKYSRPESLMSKRWAEALEAAAQAQKSQAEEQKVPEVEHVEPEPVTTKKPRGRPRKLLSARGGPRKAAALASLAKKYGPHRASRPAKAVVIEPAGEEKPKKKRGRPRKIIEVKPQSIIPFKEKAEIVEAESENENLKLIINIQCMILNGIGERKIKKLTGADIKTIRNISSELALRYGNVSYPSKLEPYKRTVLRAALSINGFLEVMKEYDVNEEELRLFVIKNKADWPKELSPNPASGLKTLAIVIGVPLALYALYVYMFRRGN